MQVELVGCTSAGKSTLAARILEAGRAEGIDLALGDKLVLQTIGLRRLQSQWMRAVCIHVVAICGCVLGGWRHIRFVALANRALRQAKIPRRQRWNQLRKVLKQFGRYEMIRRFGNDATVVVDEGTLHAAHNLFVHVGGAFNGSLVEQFASQVPLPDVSVYVKCDERLLVERTINRGHPRIPNPTPNSVSKFVQQAVITFDELSRHKRIAPRTLVVQDGVVVSKMDENDDSGVKDLLKVLRRATQSMASSKPPNHELAMAIHGGSS